MSGTPLFTPGTYASIPNELLADEDIGLAAKVAYLGLASFLGNKDAKVWPGPASIHLKTGLSRRAIQKGIDRLVSAGWIEKASKAGQEGTNLYVLHTQRTKCASAPNALPLAHEMPLPSAPDAPKELNRRTPLKKCASAKPPPDSRIKEFIDWFSGTFKTARGVGYVVNGGKDGATVQRLLKSMDLAALKQAAQVMLADPWGRERASIGLLSSQINTWRGGPGRSSKRQFAPAQVADMSAYADIGKKYE